MTSEACAMDTISEGEYALSTMLVISLLIFICHTDDLQRTNNQYTLERQE